jgi:hypothetical protein
VPAKIHSPQELVAALPTKRYQVQNPDQEVDDHRWDRPTDDAAIVRRGRQAFQRLKGDKTWADWIAVGEALLVGRRAAMLDAHTNRPAGRRYNEIFGTWLKSHGFGCLDKSDRAKLMVCMDRRTEIDTWRLSLPSNQRLQINHPASVLRHLKASTQIPTTNKKMSPIAKLQTAHAEIIDEKTKQQPKKSKPDLEELLRDLGTDELLTALEAARWDTEKLTALAHCIERAKAPVAVQGGSSKKSIKEEAPEQVQPEPDEVKSMLMDIAIYAVKRDGKVHPNDYNWRLRVLRAKAMLEFKARDSGLLPVAREQ